ncbi:MAG: hypothetical protein ACRD68_13925, partial [Pyrinomonadaceae bacterium]
MKTLLIGLLLMSAAVQAARAQVGPIQNLTRLYDYDAKQPLDVKEAILYERNGVRVHDVSYA